MAKNNSLGQAKKAKKDEFYTLLTDIEKELRHYKEHFRDKTVLCNCDDPRVSNFFKYFALNFEHLGLKRLITTCYKSQEIEIFSTEESEKAVYLIYEGEKNKDGVVDLEKIEVKPLKGDGDFRSLECVELLKQADIVVTNPPFSLFREYVAQLVKYDKKFLIIGNINCVKYVEIFPYIVQNKMWMGYKTMGTDMLFDTTEVEKQYLLENEKPGSKYKIIDGKVFKRSACCWLTNLDNDKRHQQIPFFRKYDPQEYPKYNNFDAIDVPKIEDIPVDYNGLIGVPITFLDYYNPEQFEIIGSSEDSEWLKKIGVKPLGTETIKLMKSQKNKSHLTAKMVQLYMINEGKFTRPYARILIRKKQ